MSLNWTMISSTSGGPVPLPEEMTISRESEVEVIVKIPDRPPGSDSSSGGSGGVGRTLKELGTVWVTNQRFIFLPANSSKDFQSLSVPLTSIVSTSFVQPFFSANYLNLVIHPTPQGGLSNGTTVEVRFKDRGMFQWVSMVDATRSNALIRKREERLGEPLPLYEPPPEAESAREQIAIGRVSAERQRASQPSDNELPSYSA